MSSSWKNDPLSWTNTTPSKAVAPPAGVTMSLVDTQVPSSSSGGGSSMTDLLGAVGGASMMDSSQATPPKRVEVELYGDPPMSESSSLLTSPSAQTPRSSGSTPKRVWNPPLVGDLPDDFLRIIPTAAQQASLSGLEGGAIHAIRTNESTPVGSGRSSPQVTDRRRSPRRSTSLHSRTSGASPVSHPTLFSYVCSC